MDKRNSLKISIYETDETLEIMRKVERLQRKKAREFEQGVSALAKELSARYDNKIKKFIALRRSKLVKSQQNKKSKPRDYADTMVYQMFDKPFSELTDDEKRKYNNELARLRRIRKKEGK